MRHGTRVSLVVAGAVLCTAGILTAVVHEVWGGRIPLFPKLGPAQQLGATALPQSSTGPREVAANLGDDLGKVTDDVAVIREDMSIFWVSRYKTCGHDRVRELPPAPETIGWDYQKYAQYYPGYTLSELATNLRMEHVVDQYCPDHYIIRSEADGSIWVYRNVDGLKELNQLVRMSFTIEQVPEDYRELLRNGMAFGSIEEIEGLIEDAET